MMLAMLLAVVGEGASKAPKGQLIELTPKLVITSSATIAPKVYSLPCDADDGSSAAITIKGENITVDFGGATLEGTPQVLDPDKRKGTAILVEGANVTLKNLKVRGYKIGLIARNVPGIRILDSDFSYNWKQRLRSTLEREDLSDWMSYHQNEKDEWLRYGCGIYLRKCERFEVAGVRAVGGQNGLMLTECDKGLVWNCDFSFLSGAGIAMYRSSDNRIMHNKVDWCVRGYSHGVYNRGQDSSGIIVYEQSNRNVFAFNSVTHGGDGFFLWAGQTTMDTGQGGCNDNILFGNDFSHAPANGIEATFSRNAFVNNLMLENWHGIWGGFSYDTKVIGNYFGLNGEGIAWEHGQNNLIAHNVFRRDRSAINLWQNERLDPNWGYGKVRDCTSRDFRIERNHFDNVAGPVLRLRDTQNVHVSENLFTRNGQVFALGGSLPGLSLQANRIEGPEEDLSAFAPTMALNNWVTNAVSLRLPPAVDANGTELGRLTMSRDAYLEMFVTPWDPYDAGWNGADAKNAAGPYAQARLPGGMDPFLPPGALRGRRYILVDEWGPYDFKRPILWPRGEVKAGPELAGRIPPESRPTAQLFEILGPKGTWRVTRMAGVEAISKRNGTVPDRVEVLLPSTTASNISIEMEYKGEATTDYRGIVTPKGQPVRFSFRKFFAPINWTVKWFAYDKNTQEPRTQYAAFLKLLREGKPIKEAQLNRLDVVDGYPGLPRDYYATFAEGTITLPPGAYTLNVTSDDGVRVWVDGVKVIENWTWHGPTLDTATLTGGTHRLRVEHFEIDGYSCLKVDVQPKR